MKMTSIAIIGLGWLGKPLAFSFQKKGFRVYTGTRDDFKLQQFNAFGFIGFQISFDLDSVKIHLSEEELNQISYLIICIPPTGFKNYSETILSIVSQFNEKTKVIFTSSTGVYEEINGQVDENSIKIPNHPVFLAEQNLEKLAGNRLTILRLAGLIGHNRHPARYFIDKKTIPNSNAPVNLVCQEDVINAIHLIIEKQLFSEVFNIVNPFHPSKKDYYLAAAKELFGTSMTRTDEGVGGKLILGTKFERESGFNYLFPIDNLSELLKTNEYN